MYWFLQSRATGHYQMQEIPVMEMAVHERTWSRVLSLSLNF